MKRWSILCLLCLVLGFLVTAPSSSMGGQLDQASIAKERKWRPTGCHAPVAPSIKVYDIVTYNVAVSMFNTYRDEVSAYFVCASAEAEADYKTFRAILANSLEGLQGDVRAQFDGLKSDLELSRKAFE